VPPQRNIYQQQVHNKRLTLVVMFLFILFLGFIGIGFDYFLLGSIGEEPLFFPLGTVMAIGFGSGSAVWSLQQGGKAVLKSTGAIPVNAENPTHRQLLNVVEEMKIASGLPQPSVYVIPDADPNAFATGKDPTTSAIAVTQGLLDTLNREELQGVIAHEMSHIRNCDIRLMTVVAALVGATLLLSDWASRSMWYSSGKAGRKRDSGGGSLLMIVWIIGMILAPLITRLMALAVSREREYLADASAAEMTRNPLGLASALQRIDAASAPTASIKKGAAHLCIADPLGKKFNAKEGFVAELFGTHPPIEKRIFALKAMAYQYGT
jgi:heat shock protein HtpX